MLYTTDSIADASYYEDLEAWQNFLGYNIFGSEFPFLM